MNFSATSCCCIMQPHTPIDEIRAQFELFFQRADIAENAIFGMLPNAAGVV